MNKVISLILVFACMLGLSACAENLTINNDTEIPAAKEESEISEAQIPKTPEESEPVKPAEKYTVSKEEWLSALRLETPVTQAAQHVYYPDSVNRDPFIYYDVIVYGDNVIYVYDMDKTLTQITNERYFVKKDDSCVHYTKDINGGWKTENVPLSYYTGKFDRVGGWDGEYGMEECFSYEDFTYDQAEQAYKCETLTTDMGGQAYTFYNIVLKFRNGKLESFYMEGVIDGYNCINTILSYDEVDIDIPLIP